MITIRKPAFKCSSHHSLARSSNVRGLESSYSQKMRWNPNATTDIRSNGKWYTFSCNEASISATAATARSAAVVHILSSTPNEIGGVDCQSSNWSATSDQRDSACLCEVRKVQAILLVPMVSHSTPHGCQHALLSQHVFNRKRNAMDECQLVLLPAFHGSSALLITLASQLHRRCKCFLRRDTETSANGLAP